jgi:hypothetical protein
VVELRLEALPLLLAGRKAVLEGDRADEREVRIVRLEVCESEDEAYHRSNDQHRAGDRG